jgi:hypothetical protein
MLGSACRSSSDRTVERVAEGKQDALLMLGERTCRGNIARELDEATARRLRSK